jgi:hypothetical protein
LSIDKVTQKQRWNNLDSIKTKVKNDKNESGNDASLKKIKDSAVLAILMFFNKF